MLSVFQASHLTQLVLVAMAFLCAAACSSSRQSGGDPFLQTCSETCDDGLQCVCGVCTRECSSAGDCSGLAGSPACLTATTALGAACDGSSRVCASECGSDGDCAVFADGECSAGVCRERPRPFVMFILDTSGSMELRGDGCACTSLSCMECMPDCDGGQMSRWIGVVEAMTGNYIDGACTLLERTEENGATFDIGYYRDHVQPPQQAEQRDDGILNEYAGRVHFGAATFDGWDTYLGAPPLVPSTIFDFRRSRTVDGAWSYGNHGDRPRVRPDGTEAGKFKYPDSPTDFLMDTGIRNASADNGALLASFSTGTDATTNGRIADMIRQVRPWGGTPIAAALDDLDAFFRDEIPAIAYAKRAGASMHVVVLTDGKPDDDYRKFGCDCTHNDNTRAVGYCGPDDGRNDPRDFNCPYPRADMAARNLRCGWNGDGTDCRDSMVDSVHVVSLALPGLADAGTDDGVVESLEDIAVAGGTTARHADSGDLREQLAAVLDEILQ